MNLTPKTSAARVDHVVIEKYLEALFGDYDWQEGEGLCLRGLNEKGVVGGKHFAENAWVRADGSGRFGAVEPVGIHTERWCEHGHGAFMVPAVVRVGNPGDGAKDADVIAYTSLCLDLDNPEHSEAARASIEFAIGPASMVVESSPGKLHLYWLFNEPETDTAKVARMRHILALKTGGDPAFQRLPQVIRIPGSIHGKGGVKSEVTLLHCDPDCRHSFEFLADKIEEMYQLPFAAAAAPKELARVGAGAGGGLRFTPDTSAGPSAPGEVEVAGGMLTTTVHEGGTGAVNRWSVFNNVAGHYIHTARLGQITLAEAKALASGWAAAHMVPTWDAPRFEAEWTGLLDHDIKDKGAISTAAPLFTRQDIQAPAENAGKTLPAEVQANPLLQWAGVLRYPKDVRPVRKWLAKGLVRVGSSHVLAAEGGVGKTLSLMELAMKVAAPLEGDMWLGCAMDPAHTGGTAVLITAEDDVEECHIRLNALDPDGSRRERAQYKLLIVPLQQAGGAFPLVEIGAGGIAKASPSWSKMLTRFQKIKDLQLVAIDTLAATLHGEENASLTLQQYMTALGLVQGRDVAPQASTFVTHHVRKPDKAEPVKTAADMRNAIRGSNALLGAARMVIGIWEPSGWNTELEKMGRPVEQGTLFRVAVVKANNSEALREEKTVVRGESGALVDRTDELAKLPKYSQAQLAWLFAAIVRAVEANHAYTTTDISEAGQSLPTGLTYTGKQAEFVKAMVEDLKKKGLIFISTDPKSKARIDITKGKLATNPGLYEHDTSEYKPDWTGWKFNSLTGTITWEVGGKSGIGLPGIPQ